VQEFSGNPSEVFEGAHQIDGGPPPNWDKMKEGDVEAWIDAVLFPPYIVANATAANDANAVFAIRRKAQVSSPLFGPNGSGPRSFQINTSHKAVEWEGVWSSNAVSVTIVSVGGGNMSASVLDTTADPTLQLQETFRLGQPGWAISAFALGIQQELRTIGNTAASAVIRATAKTVQPQLADDHERVAAAIHKVAQAELNEKKVKISGAKLVRATKAAAAVAKLPRSAVMLSHGIGLTLYDEFEEGHKVGSHMLYERLIPVLGIRLASERLSFYPILH
jgi:hypothetical protein